MSIADGQAKERKDRARQWVADRLEAYTKLVAALTPSAETKADYAGEFKETIVYTDSEGNEYAHDVMISWTTIKAIMARIGQRGGLK